MRCPALVSPLITLQRGGGGEIKDSRAVLGGRRRVEGQRDPRDMKARVCAFVCVDPPTPTPPPTSLFKHHWSELGHPPPAPQMIKTSAARSENIERNDFTQVAVRWVGSCFTFGEKRVFSSTFFFFSLICMSLIIKSNFEHANDLSVTST